MGGCGADGQNQLRRRVGDAGLTCSRWACWWSAWRWSRWRAVCTRGIAHIEVLVGESRSSNLETFTQLVEALCLIGLRPKDNQPIGSRSSRDATSLVSYPRQTAHLFQMWPRIRNRPRPTPNFDIMLCLVRFAINVFNHHTLLPSRVGWGPIDQTHSECHDEVVDQQRAHITIYGNPS